MKKKMLGIWGALIAAIMLVGAPSLAVADELCVSRDAYSETIVHDAVGEETIPNPEYVPATEGYWDSENGVVTVVKWNWTGGPVDATPAPPTVDPAGWHLVGETNDSKGWATDVVHQGNGKASYFYFQSTLTPVWVEGTPAVGEEFIPNPDYIPGWTEVIEHDAVVCKDDPEEPTEPPVDPPVVPEPEEPIPPVIDPPIVEESVGSSTEVIPTVVSNDISARSTAVQSEQLAVTGSEEHLGYAIGLGVVLLSVGVGLISHRLRSRVLNRA